MTLNKREKLLEELALLDDEDSTPNLGETEDIKEDIKEEEEEKEELQAPKVTDAIPKVTDAIPKKRRGNFKTDEDGNQIVKVPPKEKKPRTEKQIEAFNKMKEKQREKNEMKQKAKQEKEEVKTVKKQARKQMLDKKEKEIEMSEMEMENEFENKLVQKAIAVKKRQLKRMEMLDRVKGDEEEKKELPTTQEVKEKPKYIFY